MGRAGLGLLMLLLCTRGLVTAGEVQTLDIVPKRAPAVLAVRQLDALVERGDRLISETGIKVPIRLSDGIRWLLGHLGVNRGLDRRAPLAVMVIAVDEKEKAFSHIVVVLPFTTLGEMASNFKLDADKLAAGDVVSGKLANGQAVQFAASETHLYFGQQSASVRAAREQPRLGPRLPAEDAAALNKADILLHASAQTWQELWGDDIEQAVRRLGTDLDPEEKKTVARLEQLAESVELMSAAVNLEHGIRVDWLTLFQEEKLADIRPLLAVLGGGSGKVELTGLPQGEVLMAQAVRGNGKWTAQAARLTLRLALREVGNQHGWFAGTDQPLVVGIFSDIWHRLQGGRMAVYASPKPQETGALSVVAILDVESGQAFLKELEELCTLGHGSPRDGSDTAQVSPQRIGMLVRQLGHDDFFEREAAMTKLMLIGEEALPLLEEAGSLDDPEIRYRAKILIQRIESRQKRIREELLSKQSAARLQPGFVYYRQAETLLDTPIDIVQVELAGAESAVLEQLQVLLGAEWSKIRLARIAGRVVVLFGSDTTLLEQSIEHLRSDESPLMTEQMLAGASREAAAGRQALVAVSFDRIARWLTPAGQAPAAGDAGTASPGAASTATLHIGEDRLLLRAEIPAAEVKALVEMTQR